MARGDAEPVGRIFISYSRKDAAFANRIDEALRWRGFEPLMDRSEIFAFEEWWQRIETLIARADTVLLVLSPDALSSEIVAKELHSAVALNKRLAAVVARSLEGCALPEALQRIRLIQFMDESTFDDSAKTLIESLKTDIGWIRMGTNILQLALDWIAHDRRRDYLITGQRLVEAEAWIAAKPANAPAPSAAQVEFLKASRDARSKWLLGYNRTPPKQRPLPKAHGPKIFISYRRSDTLHIAGRIYDRLKAEFSEDDIFFDVDDIPFGVNFKEHISGALNSSSVVLALIGQSWTNRAWKRSRRWLTLFKPQEDFVLSEIELALDFGVPIVPLLIDNVDMPSGADLPDSIVGFVTLNAAPVRGGRDFHADMNAVLDIIRPLRAQGLMLKKDADA